MRLVLQRVLQASVQVEENLVAEIGMGLLAFVGLGQADDYSKLAPAAKKMLELRIFPDQDDRFQYSALDCSAEILLVPQFTLYADTSKGRRPDFFSALKPELAQTLFLQFVELVQSRANSKVAAGQFGANMAVSLINSGPVTICLNDSDLE